MYTAPHCRLICGLAEKCHLIPEDKYSEHVVPALSLLACMQLVELLAALNESCLIDYGPLLVLAT